MTRYLLDTNVLSELRKSRQDPSVRAFVAAAPSFVLYMSILSIGELHKGIELKRRSDAISAASLQQWAEALEAQFADRIISVDIEAAKLWGKWQSQRSRPIIDTFLAATATVNNMVFVTRNVRDVQDLPVQVLNPWTR